MDEHGPSLDGRARRALALMGVAAVALAAVAGIYLRWTAPPAPPPPPTAAGSLYWLSDRAGWVFVTDSHQRSVLFHTVDGGRHWDRQYTTSDTGSGVRFLDSNEGLVTDPTPLPGANPTVLRTQDGGAHWAPIRQDADIGSQPSLPFFLDLEHGWTMVRTGRSDTTEDAVIYRTDDGGRDWTEVASVDPVSWASHGLEEEGLKRWLAFRTAADGYLGSIEPDGSASISLTHDGGADWRRVPLPAPAGGWAPGDTLTLLPPTVGVSGEGAMLVIDAPRPSGGRARVGRGPGSTLPAALVYRTHDAGQTWDPPSPAPPGVDLRLADPGFLAGSAFVNGAVGWLTAGGSAYLTVDSGLTWSRQGTLPGGLTFAGLAPVDDTVAVAVAARSAALGSPWELVATRDAGRTWRELPSPPD
jgi:photosystem II stability/assembly factor-like uncharacterized protein